MIFPRQKPLLKVSSSSIPRILINVCITPSFIFHARCKAAKRRGKTRCRTLKNLPNHRSPQQVPLSRKLHSLHFVLEALFLKYILPKLYPALKFKKKCVFTISKENTTKKAVECFHEHSHSLSSEVLDETRHSLFSLSSSEEPSILNLLILA